MEMAVLDDVTPRAVVKCSAASVRQLSSVYGHSLVDVTLLFTTLIIQQVSSGSEKRSLLMDLSPS
jgi:hypothetical protein